MIFFATKDDVVNAYQKIGEPLDEDLLGQLDSVDAELKSLGRHKGFVVLGLECRVCTHRQVAIAPVGRDLAGLECEHCGNMSCQPVEKRDWE